MQISRNISLKPFNTFGIDVSAKLYSSFSNVDELAELINRNPQIDKFILGGGSNILFTKQFDGIVLKKRNQRN